MGGNVVQAQPGDVADGGRQTHCPANVGRSRFIFERDVVVNGFFKGDFLDHFPTAHPRRQFLQQLPFSPQRADAGGRVQLVAGKGVQVAAQFLNVHIHVGNSLGSVNQHDGFLPVLLGERGHFPHGINRSQRIGNVSHGYDAGAWGKHVPVSFHVQSLARRQGNRFQDGARAFAQHLPGNDIGMVFGSGYDDFVSRFDHAGRGDGIRRQVDAHRAAGSEQDFRRFRRVDEPRHRFPRFFMRFRRELAQVVGAAVHIGVFRIVVMADGVQHGQGFLRSGRIIQVNERLAVHAGFQNGELRANGCCVKHGYGTSEGSLRNSSQPPSRMKMGARMPYSGFFSSLATAALEVQSLLQKMTMQNPLSSAVIRASMAFARSSW